jgi:hypothetical protein
MVKNLFVTVVTIGLAVSTVYAASVPERSSSIQAHHEEAMEARNFLSGLAHVAEGAVGMTPMGRIAETGLSFLGGLSHHSHHHSRRELELQLAERDVDYYDFD